MFRTGLNDDDKDPNDAGSDGKFSYEDDQSNELPKS